MIKQLNRRKAPRPDDRPIELLKELTGKHLRSITKLIQGWWENETLPEEELRARVVLTYQKGDTHTQILKLQTYLTTEHPIQNRCSNVPKKHITDIRQTHTTNTQFGFRKDNITADAIHLIRRVVEY